MSGPGGLSLTNLLQSYLPLRPEAAGSWALRAAPLGWRAGPSRTRSSCSRCQLRPDAPVQPPERRTPQQGRRLWRGPRGGVQGAEPLGGALLGVRGRSCCRPLPGCSPAAAGPADPTAAAGRHAGPVPLLSYSSRPPCGEPTWVSWAGRGQHAPRTSLRLCRGTGAHALHLLRAQPDALAAALTSPSPDAAPAVPPRPPSRRQLVLLARAHWP